MRAHVLTVLTSAGHRVVRVDGGEAEARDLAQKYQGHGAAVVLTAPSGEPLEFFSPVAIVSSTYAVLSGGAK